MYWKIQFYLLSYTYVPIFNGQKFTFSTERSSIIQVHQ